MESIIGNLIFTVILVIALIVVLVIAYTIGYIAGEEKYKNGYLTAGTLYVTNDNDHTQLFLEPDKPIESFFWCEHVIFNIKRIHPSQK